MEAVRQYIEADKLQSIIPLPKAWLHKQLEIIILPVEDTDSGQTEICNGQNKTILSNNEQLYPVIDGK